VVQIHGNEIKHSVPQRTAIECPVEQEQMKTIQAQLPDQFKAVRQRWLIQFNIHVQAITHVSPTDKQTSRQGTENYSLQHCTYFGIKRTKKKHKGS
jgi:hypothetical protein